MFRIAVLLMAAVFATAGCHPRRVDMEKQSTGEPRTNEAINAPSGLQHNPGQPVPERPMN